MVALRFRLPIDEMALCHEGPLAGYVRLLRAPQITRVAKDKTQPSRLTWTLVRRDTEHRAIVSLAGPVAEAKLLGTTLRSHGCKSDLSKCQLFCSELDRYRRNLVETYAMNIPEVEPVEMANRLRKRTLTILAHRDTWRAVTALAGDLEGWSRLTGHDAADTVQWTRQIANQLGLLLPMPLEANGRQTHHGSSRDRGHTARRVGAWPSSKLGHLLRTSTVRSRWSNRSAGAAIRRGHLPAGSSLLE